MFKMEKAMSSNANDVNLTEISSFEEVTLPSLSVGGRESKGDMEVDYVMVKRREEEVEDVDEDDTEDEEDSEIHDIDEDDEDDDDEEEEDEEWLERLRILKDARNLKKVASFFLNPEKSVEVDPINSARCFFGSAAEQESKEEADERARVLEDAMVLKQNAVTYYYPESPIKNTGVSTSMGRNYFTRPSAEDQESKEESDERARILADAQLLKKHAEVYYHPEAPIDNSGVSTSMGRNYFTRPSAEDQELKEEADERARILADAQLLKKHAEVYYHPEAPIDNSGVSTSMGRNYFTRPSAEDQESKEEADERARILADTQSLKMTAMMFHLPEAPVDACTDGTLFGRNYFSRPSAVDGFAENVSSKGCKVEPERKIPEAPKKIIVPIGKSMTKNVFDGKLCLQNDSSDIPRSASAVMLFNPDADMGEAF